MGLAACGRYFALAYLLTRPFSRMMRDIRRRETTMPRAASLIFSLGAPYSRLLRSNAATTSAASGSGPLGRSGCAAIQ